MSTLRMRDEFLENRNGEKVEIPFEVLRDECLRIPKLSIVEIVLEAIKKLTGEECMKANIRNSSLFSRLEAAILADESYQQRREEKKALYQKIKVARQEEQIRDGYYGYRSDIVERAKRRLNTSH